MNNKEGLKNIVSRSPFVPTAPIKRKEFFIGFIIIAVVGLLINIGVTLLLGENIIFLAGVIAIVASYVTATWSTKRFLDIRPKTNAKFLQIALFALFIVLNILTYIQAGMMAEYKVFSDYIVMNGLDAISGAPEVSQTTTMYAVPVSIARAILGIPLAIFALVLLIKKGREIKNIG